MSNAITGRPVPRVLIQVDSPAARPVLTGAEGEFSFSGLAGGAANISFWKAGLLHPGDANRGLVKSQLVQIGPDTGKLLLKLAPEAVISGRVTGKDEDPVEGATVEVLSSRTRRGGQRELNTVFRMGFGLALAPSVQSDENGNFRIAGLSPGTYYVLIKSESLTRQMRAARQRANRAPAAEAVSYPALVYYPGVTDLDVALPLQLSSGQHVSIDFSLKQVPAFRVSGSISGISEVENLNYPMFVGEDSQPILSPEEFDPATGAFAFRSVPVGTYTLRLGGKRENGSYVNSFRKLTVDGPVKDLNVPFGAVQDIPVIVHKVFTKARQPSSCSTTGPDGEMHTSDCSDYPAVSVILTSAASQGGVAQSQFGPQSDPNNIKVQGVSPGRYRVRATDQFRGYVASLRCGSVDLLRDDLLVPEEGSVSPIEVTLRDDGAQVKVLLKENGPPANGWAVLVPDILTRDPVVLDVNAGTERGYALPPGEYKAFALDSRDEVDSSYTDWIEKYADKAVHVSLTANATTNIVLDLIRTGD